ncbi:MAG: glycine cleavage system protein GcvH [Rubrobacteraceae bacterium]
MSIPQDLQYTKSHEWVRAEDDGIATVGITDHAQEELGDVVYVELPAEGDSFDAGETFGTVESVKAVSDLYAPVGGEVVEVNTSLEDSPEKINEDPYGDGWILKLRTSGDSADLLSAADYEKVLEEEQ